MKALTRGEQKSLALHRSVAAKLLADPSLRAVARQRVAWLCARNPGGTKYYDEWATLLDGSIGKLVDAMVSPSEHGCALRQENPFVDLVDQKERARIFRETAAAIDRASDQAPRE